ncbi:hypothetical protein [Streptococcus infantis]
MGSRNLRLHSNEFLNCTCHHSYANPDARSCHERTRKSQRKRSHSTII